MTVQDLIQHQTFINELCKARPRPFRSLVNACSEEELKVIVEICINCVQFCINSSEFLTEKQCNRLAKFFMNKKELEINLVKKYIIKNRELFQDCAIMILQFVINEIVLCVCNP